MLPWLIKDPILAYCLLAQTQSGTSDNVPASRIIPSFSMFRLCASSLCRFGQFCQGNWFSRTRSSEGEAVISNSLIFYFFFEVLNSIFSWKAHIKMSAELHTLAKYCCLTYQIYYFANLYTCNSVSAVAFLFAWCSSNAGHTLLYGQHTVFI